MPAVAKFYMAERVRELLVNWARWPGWQSGGSSRSTLAWLDDFVSNKRVGDYQAKIPVMGGDAADTHHALGRMSLELSQVLVAHYTSRGHIDDKLDRLNKTRRAAERISRRSYYRLLERAHPAFMEEFNMARESASVVSAKNASTAPADAPRAVASRYKLQVYPKMGLKSPEKPSGNKGESGVDENGP